MRPLNIIIISLLAVFLGITLYIYHSSHLKAALWTFAFYYIVWEMMVAQLTRIDRDEFTPGQDENSKGSD